MESSIRFFRIRGIPVGADWSWLFVFGLVVWSLSIQSPTSSRNGPPLPGRPSGGTRSR